MVEPSPDMLIAKLPAPRMAPGIWPNPRKIGVCTPAVRVRVAISTITNTNPARLLIARYQRRDAKRCRTAGSRESLEPPHSLGRLEFGADDTGSGLGRIPTRRSALVKPTQRLCRR